MFFEHKITMCDKLKGMFFGIKKKQHEFKQLENDRFKRNMQKLFNLKLIKSRSEL